MCLLGVIDRTEGNGPPKNQQPQNFGSKKLFSVAHLTQKNSSNSTVPLFLNSENVPSACMYAAVAFLCRQVY